MGPGEAGGTQVGFHEPSALTTRLWLVLSTSTLFCKLLGDANIGAFIDTFNAVTYNNAICD